MNTRTWSAAAGSREFRSWHHLPRIPGSDPSHLDLGFSSQDSLAWWGKAHPLCLLPSPAVPVGRVTMPTTDCRAHLGGTD